MWISKIKSNSKIKNNINNNDINFDELLNEKNKSILNKNIKDLVNPEYFHIAEENIFEINNIQDIWMVMDIVIDEISHSKYSLLNSIDIENTNIFQWDSNFKLFDKEKYDLDDINNFMEKVRSGKSTLKYKINPEIVIEHNWINNIWELIIELLKETKNKLPNLYDELIKLFDNK